jgi:hypothetical protein
VLAAKSDIISFEEVVGKSLKFDPSTSSAADSNISLLLVFLLGSTKLAGLKSEGNV